MSNAYAEMQYIAQLQTRALFRRRIYMLSVLCYSPDTFHASIDRILQRLLFTLPAPSVILR